MPHKSKIRQIVRLKQSGISDADEFRERLRGCGADASPRRPVLVLNTGHAPEQRNRRSSKTRPKEPKIALSLESEATGITHPFVLHALRERVISLSSPLLFK